MHKFGEFREATCQDSTSTFPLEIGITQHRYSGGRIPCTPRFLFEISTRLTRLLIFPRPSHLLNSILKTKSVIPRQGNTSGRRGVKTFFIPELSGISSEIYLTRPVTSGTPCTRTKSWLSSNKAPLLLRTLRALKVEIKYAGALK